MPIDSISYFNVNRSAASDNGPWTTIEVLDDQSTTTVAFTVPAKGGDVTVTVADVSWISVDQYVNVALAGLFKVVGKAGNDLALRYLNESYNTRSDNVIPIGSQVLPGSYVDTAVPNPTFWYKLEGKTANGITITYNVMSVSSATPGQIQWVQVWHGGLNDSANGVAVDTQGNVIVASSIAGLASIRKYNSGGALLWNYAFGFSTFPLAICADTQGNVYWTGYTVGPFCPNNAPPCIPPIGTGGDHCIVVKLDSNGNYQWGQYVLPVSDADFSYGYDIVYRSGFLWIVGSCGGTVNFGGAPFTSQQSRSIMVFKLDAATGAFTGVGSLYGLAGSGMVSEAKGIAFMPDGGPVLVGKVRGSPTDGGVNFGNGTPTLRPEDQDGTVGFVVRFNSSLQAQWALQTGVDFREDEVRKVAVDPTSGNIFVCGIFRGAFDLGGATIPSLGGLEFYQDGFLASVTSAGVGRWARPFRGSFGVHDHANTVRVANNGDILVGGMMSGVTDFGSGPVTMASGDGFLARYHENNGSLIWVKTWGGPSQDPANWIAVDASDNIYVAGSWVGNTQIGGANLGDGIIRYGPGGSEAFLSKYSA